MPSFPLPAVLSISGHDPSGGAGIQADIETLSALDCQPATVVTCLTVQDSSDIFALHPAPVELVRQQAAAIIADYPVRAVKIGLIGYQEIGEAIIRILRELPGVPVVLDPVLATGAGTDLADSAMRRLMVEQLLPLCTLATPNSIEARRLGGSDDLRSCAETLLGKGCRNLLITGTHENSDQVINTLYRPRMKPIRERWPRLPHSYHGSGCTLASAVAAYLAHGREIEEAVSRAQSYTWNALYRGRRPGRGQYIPARLPPRHLAGEKG